MERMSDTVKWLRLLVWTAAVSLINSVIDWTPWVHGDITTWISRGIMLANIICMFRLAPENVRYKRAGIFRTVWLGCALVTSFLFGSYLLTIAASVASFFAVYQEYCAHSELAADRDETLSRNWRRLFWWEIAAGLLLSAGSSVAALVLMTYDQPISAGRISAMVIFILDIPRSVLSVVYWMLLKKTVDCVSAGEQEV